MEILVVNLFMVKQQSNIHAIGLLKEWHADRLSLVHAATRNVRFGYSSLAYQLTMGASDSVHRKRIAAKSSHVYSLCIHVIKSLFIG